MDGGESERPSMTHEAGELDPEDPAEERRAPGHETVRRIFFLFYLVQIDLHETRTDSGTGEESA